MAYLNETGLSHFWDKVKNKIASSGNETVKRVYPVGSIYMSSNSTSPASLFGGSWEKIQDKFLLAAGSTYAAGSTGGSSMHKHWYGLILGGYYGMFVGENSELTGALVDGKSNKPTGFYNRVLPDMVQNVNGALQQNSKEATPMRVESRTTTSEESSMPPYLSVYMWKRVS